MIGTTIVPAGPSYDASARTIHWFEVEFEQTPGWISRYFVWQIGDCGYPDEVEST